MVKEMATSQESITPSVASRASPSPYPRLPAVFALPLLAFAVSLVLYLNDLWWFGQFEFAPRVLYVPIPSLASAAPLGFGVWWYAAARPPAALAGAAALFVLLSLVAVGFDVGGAVARQHFIESAQREVMIEPAQRGFMLTLALAALGFAATVLRSVAYMLVACAIAPAWRKRSYWLIALIVWPLATYLIVISAGLVVVLVMVLVPDPQSITEHLNFAGVVARQCVVLGFIGYWLGKENKRREKISAAGGSPVPEPAVS